MLIPTYHTKRIIMSNIAIFQKHLGQAFNHSSHNLATNIQDINIAISTLQTLNIRLKKCQTLLQNNQVQDFLALAKSCTFMDKELFDTPISISLFGETQIITVQNLSHLYQTQPQSTLTYIQDLQSHIAQTLEWIGNNIDIQTPTPQKPLTSAQDYQNSFIKA